MSVSTEQMARLMLERMEIQGAQNFSAGELVELANLIAERNAARSALINLAATTREALAKASRYLPIDGENYVDHEALEAIQRLKEMITEIEQQTTL